MGEKNDKMMKLMTAIVNISFISNLKIMRNYDTCSKIKPVYSKTVKIVHM